MAICQRAEAVVTPANVNDQAASQSQIDNKLRRVKSELQEVVLQMESQKDSRKNKIQNIQRDLERISHEQVNREEKYCNGRVAWALDQKCPE